jgi:hypothetical protein
MPTPLGVQAIAARERIRLVVLPAAGGKPTQVRLHLFHIEAATMRPAMSSWRFRIVTSARSQTYASTYLRRIFSSSSVSMRTYRLRGGGSLSGVVRGEAMLPPRPGGGSWLKPPGSAPAMGRGSSHLVRLGSSPSKRVRTSR